MSYEKWVNEYYEKNEGLRNLIKELKNLKGKKVLYYSHDDPDGITSAVIMIEILKKAGAKVKMSLPPSFELEKSRVAADTKGEKFYALITTDKGTLGYFNDFTKQFKKVIVVDHHFVQGTPDKTILFNPGEWCSTSHLLHIAAVKMGLRNDFLDFINLIGLKGDWAVQPIVEKNSPFVQPFLNEAKKKFKNLFGIVKGQATWFDVTQREKTVVLNLITEFVHALCGGGFQYFYTQKDSSLKNINQPLFSYELLAGLKTKAVSLTKIKTIKAFAALSPKGKKALLIYKFYCGDYENSRRLMDSAAPLMKINNTFVYFFTGYDVSLIPMIGSVKLFELMKRDKVKEACIIMCNFEKPGSVHFSLRGDEKDIHLGKICSNIAEDFVKIYGHKDIITGGGHLVAAECKIRYTKVGYIACLKAMTDYLNCLNDLWLKKKAKKITKNEKMKAQRMGLEFTG